MLNNKAPRILKYLRLSCLSPELEQLMSVTAGLILDNYIWQTGTGYGTGMALFNVEGPWFVITIDLATLIGPQFN